MKKTFLNLIALFAAGIIFNSCGTIMGKMSKVNLVGAPSNLHAKADGEDLKIQNDLALSRLKEGMNSSTYIDYYTPTVKLNKHKPVILELSSGNSEGSVELKPKFSGTYLLGNIFVTGVVLGTAVDVATGNHKKHVRFVDVPAVLAGKPQSEWRSKHQLKRAIKKGAKA